MDDTDPLAAAAAVNAGAAHRHATRLERLAVMLLAFWVTTSTFVLAGDPSLLAAWAGIVTASVVAWAVLRGLALSLRVRADANLLAVRRPAADGLPSGA